MRSFESKMDNGDPGDTYLWPTRPDKKIYRPADMSRHLPYRNDKLSSDVMVASAQNQSGQQYEQINEGVNPSGQGSMGNSKPST